MDDSDYLELLEMYMDMVEQQNEIIYRLSKIVQRAVTDLRMIQNDQKLDKKFEEDIAIAKEVMEDFKGYTEP